MTEVSTWETFRAACLAGGDVYLISDIDMSHLRSTSLTLIPLTKSVTIHGNGYKLHGYAGYTVATLFVGDRSFAAYDLIISDCTDLAFCNIVGSSAGAFVLKNLQISAHFTSTMTYLYASGLSSYSVTLSDSTFRFTGVLPTIFGGAIYVYNAHCALDCVVLGKSSLLTQYPAVNASFSGALRSSTTTLQRYNLTLSENSRHVLIDLDLDNLALSINDNNTTDLVTTYMALPSYSLIYVRDNTDLAQISGKVGTVVYNPTGATMLSTLGVSVASAAELQDRTTYTNAGWIFSG